MMYPTRRTPLAGWIAILLLALLMGGCFTVLDWLGIGPDAERRAAAKR